MDIEEFDFEDDFADILAKDSRYHPRAYTVLLNVFGFLSEKTQGHVSGEDILEEFKEEVLDQFGPMAYTVLTEWGLKCTEDIGEMMVNLVEANRIVKEDNDSYESFAGGYDFRETFSGPYQA